MSSKYIFLNLLLSLLYINSYLVPFLISSALNAPLNTRELLDLAQNQFIAGKLQESSNSFNQIAKSRPELIPILWQRGISLYFTSDYDECQSQFEGDVALNPNDTEEIIWSVLCSAKDGSISNLEKAQKTMLELKQPDRRPVMRNVLQLFKQSPNSDKSESTLNILLEDGNKDPDGSAYFYSRLYASLYKLAAGDKKTALLYINDSLENSPYAKRFQKKDYMVAVAHNTQNKIITLLNK